MLFVGHGVAYQITSLVTYVRIVSYIIKPIVIIVYVVIRGMITWNHTFTTTNASQGTFKTFGMYVAPAPGTQTDIVRRVGPPFAAIASSLVVFGQVSRCCRFNAEINRQNVRNAVSAYPIIVCVDHIHCF